MPENIKAIRKRIGGIKNTRQLTRAMKMVSAAKLRRSQERVEGSRPYMAVLEEMISVVADPDRPLSPIAGPNQACLVFASDRGLCGSYNSNVIKAMVVYHQKHPQAKFFVFGRKVIDAARKRGLPVAKSFPEFYLNYDWDHVEATITDILAVCESEEIGQLDTIYTRFVSAGVQKLTERTLFPFSLEKDDQKKQSNSDLMIVEPNREEVLAALVQHFSMFIFYYIGAEVIASEHGARMAAMDQATRNAGEVIDELTLVMNRARQASITKELLEIIGGKEALEG